MSRRKQSRPRPVKAVEDIDQFASTSSLAITSSDNDASENDDEVLIDDKQLVIALSPTADDDNDNDDKADILDDMNDSKVKHSVHTSQSTSSSQIPPNFLLPSPTSAFTAPPSFLAPTSREMARRKRSPRNISWNRQAGIQSEAKAQDCQLCTDQLLSGEEPKTPVEGQEYFIDTDGTLTIKNGVCPRSLALLLFSDLSLEKERYESMLGENLVKFLLNLKQIVDKHRDVCPNETPLQAVNAQNVLKTYVSSSILKTSMSRKRLHDSNFAVEGKGLNENFRQSEKNQAKDDTSPSMPDNFLHNPINSLFSHKSSSHKSNLSNIPPEPSQILPLSFDMGSNDNNKGTASDSASTGESSRVTSPSLSMSSVTSGLGLSEAAKTMSNTKRGSKILPVSSNDGQSRYLCPVCNLELSSDHELTVHIRSHNQSGQQSMPNTCTICGKTLSSQSSLDRHMLVHSGERPFRCKICDMSFTTNGNMHRHARIHQKNGITEAKIIGRKSSDSKPATKKDNQIFPEDKFSGDSTPRHGRAQFPSMRTDFVSDKLDMLGSRQLDGQSSFLHQYYQDMKKQLSIHMGPYMLPYGAPHHPAFPYPQIMQDPTRLNLSYLSAMMDPITGESFAKQARLSHHMMPPARAPSPDLRSPRTFSCTVCQAEFTNEFSLESHMESHVIVDEKLEAEGSSVCKTCKTIAKSEESLLLHSLIHHKEKKIFAEPDTKPGRKSPSSGSSSPTSNSATGNFTTSDATLSFQNLGFASFTTKKFPLIAKAFCESNEGLRGQKFPVFKCQKCDKEFPVEGAKDLHEASHVPEEYTVCPKCDCHFTDSSRLQEHMQKHVANKKFEESQQKSEPEATESMTQSYFLVQMGLVAKDTTSSVAEPDLGMEDDNSEQMSIRDIEESAVSEDGVSKAANSDDEDAMSESSKISSVALSEKFHKESESRKQSLQPSIFLHPNATPSGPVTSGSSVQALSSSKNYRNRSQPVAGQVFNSSLPLILNSPTPSVDSETGLGIRDSPVKMLEGSMPPMFPCKYCDLVLSSPKDLKYHQRTHKNVCQFQCKVCKYASTDKSTLLRHMRTHSGERPYKCAICEYSFTTKANCERHLRQKHGLEKDQLLDKLTCNNYVIANKNSPPYTSSSNGNGGLLNQDTLCKACGVDFFNVRGLEQHLHVSPNCHMMYVCKKCKATFASRSGVLRHITRHHPEIPSSSSDRFITTLENLPASSFGSKSNLTTPPPAHYKSVPSPSTPKASLAKEQKQFSYEDVSVKQEIRFPGTQMDMKPDRKRLLGDMDNERPLDFSTQLKTESSGSLHNTNVSRSSSISVSEDDQCQDDLPIDLSVSRSSSSSPWGKGQGHSISNQRPYGLPGQLKEESGRSSNTSLNTNKNITNSAFFQDKSPQHRNDGNNNQLSPLFLSSPGVINTGHSLSQVSPFRATATGSPGSKSDVSNHMLSPKKPKHPAFSHLSMKSPYTSLLPSVAPQNPAFTGKPMSQRRSYMPNLHSILGAPVLNDNTVVPSSAQTSSRPSFDKTDKATRTSSAASGSPKTAKENNNDVSDKKTLALDELETDAKVKAKVKGSSSESDSSCELASVNKILESTDAQTFQDYLIIHETEDDQDGKSESVASGEESNSSLENMYSHSQNLTTGALLGSRPEEEPSKLKEPKHSSKEGNVDGESKMKPVTVNMALMDYGLDMSALFKDRHSKTKPSMSDPSNMSEQAIAELIEKVSRENVNSPAKKKRNSYADSPHKFSCPYCPRCFPWLSSLNRHLLTHTGQKPFKCPRCPVTFSTKSNRERHLIRKHNVNMLDPASRSTMDRPYKCHLCVFSSFSTQSNLIKHYKDRHNGVSPPPRTLEAVEKSLSDGEGDENSQNEPGNSYEDEEEFNTLAEQMRTSLTDKEIMLQNYAHDSDSNHSGSMPSTFRDPHKKRNAIFNINYDEDPVSTKNGKNNVSNVPSGVTSNSNGIALPNKLFSTSSSTRPGVDDTVLTDTMKNFLDTSVRQALESSHRRAQEEGLKFIITPAIERQLKRLPTSNAAGLDMSATCQKCDQEFPNRRLLLKHFKYEHGSELPFKCYICEMPFTTRVECLQHQAKDHEDEWTILKDRNEIRNVQVFATRLEKMIDKLCKKGKEYLDKQDSEKSSEMKDEVSAPQTDDLSEESTSLETDEKPDQVVKKNGDKKVTEEETDNGAETEDKAECDTKSEDCTNVGILQEVITTDYLQRKVYCSLCPRRFWSLQDLRRHMRSHTGERPYRCEFCFQKFTLKHSMNRHKAKHHPLECATPHDETSDDEGSSSETGTSKTKPKQAMTVTNGNHCADKDLDRKGETNSDEEGSDVDMLHNLLGVESSTIDQIFESKDSAASLLGV